MPTLEQMIAQAQRDLQALIKNSQQTRQPSIKAQQLRRELDELQARLEANSREQQKA